MKKVLASYKGPVKGLKPYLLSLMYANVVPFRQKKTTSAKVVRGENRNNVVSFIIPEKESDDNEIK